jgi:hypothetical protein
MSGSYRQCPECGKRALSIATRCPGCQRALPALEAPEAAPGRGLARHLVPILAAGVLATATVVGLAMFGRTDHPTPAPSLSTVAAGSASHSTEVAGATTAAAATDAPRLLLARTWTSVRKARNRSAMVEAVLLPGDTVLADSLAHGWYRVALEGEVLGYAHRSTLVSPDSLH